MMWVLNAAVELDHNFLVDSVSTLIIFPFLNPHIASSGIVTHIAKEHDFCYENINNQGIISTGT